METARENSVKHIIATNKSEKKEYRKRMPNFKSKKINDESQNEELESRY